MNGNQSNISSTAVVIRIQLCLL